jgi:cation transport ATPase
VQIGIENVLADAQPQDKLSKIRELQVSCMTHY